jgi:DNA-binding NtrC family response regulator
MDAHILVVDDLPAWREIMREILAEQYNVDTAASLAEAMRLLDTAGPYDVIVTDIGLSSDEMNTDGIDLLKLVHQRSPRTQTIAVSGRAASADLEWFCREYHSLIYLDRDVLSDDLQTLLDWVDKGVQISRATEE